MKGMALSVLFLALAQVASAQRANEWIRQRQTQIAYYLRQILILREHNVLLRSSYNIINSGLKFTDTTKRNDFAQHDQYFRSMRQVPSFLSSAMSLQYSLRCLDEIEHRCRNKNGSMVDGFRRHLALLRAAYDAFLSNNSLSMRDEERMQVIASWCKAVQTFYHDVQRHFTDDQLMRLQEQRSLDELQLLQKMHRP